MAYRAQQRGGTAAALATLNDVLLLRELCFETDTGLYKIGDGVTPWNSLPYYQLTGEFADGLTLDAMADPSVPAAGKLRLYGHSVAGRVLPKVLGPSGLDNPLQAGLYANKNVHLGPGATTAFSVMGIPAPTIVGTLSHPAIATGIDLRSATQRGLITSAATANAAAEARVTNHLCYRGEAFGAITSGGFFFTTRFGMSSTTALQRVAVGLFNATGAIATTQVPSALTNGIFVGWDSADTTLQLMHNDAAGAATKVNLGASFPANTLAAIYELVLFCPPNGAAIGWRVRRLDTGDTATGTITTDLPTATTLLTWHAYANNGGTAAAVLLDVYKMYLETDY